VEQKKENSHQNLDSVSSQSRGVENEEVEQKELGNDSDEDQVFFQPPNAQLGSQHQEEGAINLEQNTQDSGIIEEKFSTLNFASDQVSSKGCLAAGRGICTTDSHSEKSSSEESDSDYREIEESDWDEDLEMASRDITPGTFSGQKSEEAEEWLHSISFWIQYKRLRDDSAVAAAALLLRDGALQWFNSLDRSTKGSIEKFEDAFKRRYVELKVDQWKDVVAMFDLKQATGQSVEDFLALVKKKAKKAQPTEDQLNATVIKGLRPYLR